MGKAEWLVPAALGVAATVAAALLIHPAPAPPEPEAAAWPAAHAINPFPDVAAEGQVTLLAAWDRDVAVPAGPVEVGGTTGAVTLDAATSRLVRIHAAPGQVLHDGLGGTVASIASAPAGPRVETAKDTVRLSLYAFRGTGLLVFSNDAIHNLTRFTEDPGLIRFSDATWYLGNGTAPEGSSPLPDRLAGERQILRAAIEGLPVGGVATFRLDKGLVAQYFGPLHITVQVAAIGKP